VTVQASDIRVPPTFLQKVGWWVTYVPLRLFFMICYRYKAWGARHVPRRGPVLLLANHQSHFDPPLIGVAGHRRWFYSLARQSLFEPKYFGRMIKFWNAIPVQRGESDPAALRKGIEALKGGHPLLVFAEGERTLSGEIEAFQRGVLLLIRRAKPTIVPVAVDGAYDAWQRGSGGPKLHGKIGVAFGPAISSEQVLAMSPDDAMSMLREKVVDLQQIIRARHTAPSRS